MTNGKIAVDGHPDNPYTMTVNDMFTLMPYENSLVVFKLERPRSSRRCWSAATGTTGTTSIRPNYGGYSHYTTCMLDISAGGIITYTNDDPCVYTTTVSTRGRHCRSGPRG